MLSEKKIARLRLRPGRYGDGGGLVLQVISSTNASWLFCYERAGRAHMMGLGSLRTFSLKEARVRARAARQLLADGIDPLEKKRADRDAATLAAARNMTFKQVAEQYYATHADGWTNAKHRQQFVNTMRDYVHPVLGSLSVAAIDEPLVLKVLNPIWKDKTSTAKRVRNRIAAVLDYAAAAKYRIGGSNPARWEGNLEFLLPAPEKIATVRHHQSLPHAEMSSFVAQLQKVEGPAARALEFLILTAARTGEAVGARWSEIDLEAQIWTIPRERMKAAREHRVPLSDRACALLRALPREEDNDNVFIGTTAGSAISSMAMYRTLKALRPDITTHGFRSTFSTWAHETTAYPAHVIELSLAHTVGSAVERAYRRSDLFEKRRRLMNDWARYCSTAAKAGKVVPLRGQK